MTLGMLYLEDNPLLREPLKLENLKSFDEFLEKRFPESRRKVYYLMAIQENLTKVPKQQPVKLQQHVQD